MQKVIVIGCPGSGKSTFSKKLHDITGLPLYHLDMIRWNTDGKKIPRSDFMERLKETLNKDAWIIDGNYLSTMELRIRACDTVFFLDYPTDICIDGVKARKGRERTDMPFTALDDEDDEFMKFINNYNSESRPAVTELLRRYSHKRIMIFKNRSEADSFLSQKS
ncbi:MAG: adenylate kinase [Ruminococcus sp.]|nr:adenylate kinase [Ruminococcus sp.]